VADKAKGWEAEVLWDIEGAGSYTIFVTGGTCTTKKGKGHAATCIDKLSASTMLGMVDGTVDPQKAFMQGKISATNLADMMRFGTAFDMKKARKMAAEARASASPATAPAAAAPAPIAEPTPAEIAEEAFDRMPEIFVPEKATGWNAQILWAVEGAGDFSVNVADGECTTASGAPQSPTCTVKLTVDTFLGMIAGKVDPQRAFMEGKVTADNLGDMMRFSQTFDMNKGAELAKQADAKRREERAAAASQAAKASAATSAPAEPTKPEGLNRDKIGERYLGGAHFARPDLLDAYARATNDPNPHYLSDAEEQVAPPVFPVRLMKDAMFKAVMDKDLGVDLMTMVHGEQDMRFHRPIRPWDLVTVRAYVDSITDKSSGQLVTLRVPCYVEGELACEARATLFCKNGVKGPKKTEVAAEPEAEREPAFQSEMQVATDQAQRYAAASGDDNPIHLDENIAKMAGLPSVILHGLCTMAFASRAVVQEACEGDPGRLKRLAVRFSKPVLLDQTLTTTGWKIDATEDGSIYGFETTAADGEKVITNGVAEVA
jgi:acyl dehydratase/putative sterol carrier protein